MRDLKVLHGEWKALIRLSPSLTVSLPLPRSFPRSLSMSPSVSISLLYFSLQLVLGSNHTACLQHTQTHIIHTNLSLYPVFVESYITMSRGLIALNFDLACIKLWCYLNYFPRRFQLIKLIY